ncbi:MAG: serine/threonine protein kinase, partial [Deltaproteobacteria bacterium]|nr:serine/threonine protein kinase [Deltaproteobacteria bacterium]
MLAEDTPEELSLSDFQAEADPTPALVGARDRNFGRYRLKYQIASGGMASVFLAGAAGAAGFEKPVAIKRMHPHLARRKEYVEMFLDEARITSRINHPNVCQVFDFGETEGAYYMALEYLVGEPLTTILAHVQKRGTYQFAPWRAIAARVCVAMCEGLHAAHELRDSDGQRLDVVHRDVSPSNVIVTFDGGVKVVDFGVAKARGRLHQTTTGTLKGKFSYMAPEQVGGRGVDARSDIWSIGVCLWEMLTCKRLFRRASEMETLIAVGQGDIPNPSDLVPEIPPELAAIALRALDRNPDGRYANAREMARDLDRWIQRQSEPAGMADVADFLAENLTKEHNSKALFVQTAMVDKGGPAAQRMSAAATRLFDGGTPSGTPSMETETIPPFSESNSHTRPIHQEESTGSIAGASPPPAPQNAPLLLGIAGMLLVALVAAISGVFVAVGGGEEGAIAVIPTEQKRITPRAAAEPDETEATPEIEEPRAQVTTAEEVERARQEGRAEARREIEEENRARAAAERQEREAERERRAASSMTKRPATMQAPPTATGTLMVTGVPGGTVLVDGSRRGETLRPITGIPVGSHTITVRRNGQTRTKRTRVRASGTTVVS